MTKVTEGTVTPFEPEPGTDAPFHREEDHKVGRIVHANLAGRCCAALLVGKPDHPDARDAVYLELHPSPEEVDRARVWLPTAWWRFDPTAQLSGGYHWGRACPFGR